MKEMYRYTILAILWDRFRMLKTWLLQRLSDLQQGDQKVTLNHLVIVFVKLKDQQR